jgi:hypothetical protein
VGQGDDEDVVKLKKFENRQIILIQVGVDKYKTTNTEYQILILNCTAQNNKMQK